MSMRIPFSINRNRLRTHSLPLPRRTSRRIFPSCAGNSAGFTLLEVLVALVIVGTALGASLRAVGSLTQNSNALRGAMMATWSAENQLVQVRLNQQFPAIGKRSFDCPQGDLRLVCEENVIVSPNPRLRRVEVSVFDGAQPERRIIKLVQLVLNE
jgi:general secretion pathway protein I